MNFNSLSPKYLVIQKYVQFDLNIHLIKMDLIHTETDRDNKCLIYNNFTFRKVNDLKNCDVVYRCSSDKTCKAGIVTDKDGLGVIKIRNEHNHECSEKKAEVKQLRVRVRKQPGDITARPSKVIRQKLQTTDEKTLEPKDFKNVALSLYRERRRNQPKLPKSREEVFAALETMDIVTNKEENMLAALSRYDDIAIFACSYKHRMSLF